MGCGAGGRSSGGQAPGIWRRAESVTRIVASAPCPEPVSLPLATDGNPDATRPTRGARLVTTVWVGRSCVGTLVQPRRLSRILRGAAALPSRETGPG